MIHEGTSTNDAEKVCGDWPSVRLRATAKARTIRIHTRQETDIAKRLM
jgi:hypothetical protein